MDSERGLKKETNAQDMDIVAITSTAVVAKERKTMAAATTIRTTAAQ